MPVSPSTVTTEGAARLPTPKVGMPLSEATFQRLAQHWSGSGAWLSLWNTQGQCVSAASPAGRLWETLWRHAPGFQAALGDLASQACVGDSQRASEGPARPHVLGPWQPDIGFLAAPVRRRQHLIGIVLAGFIIEQQPSDDLCARLASQYGLDGKTLHKAASETRITRSDEFAVAAATLPLTVDQARQIERSTEEITILTHNLENTYEEQHLIYQISSMLSLPQRPVDPLKLVAQETVAVSRASAIAFVLSEREDVARPTGAPRGRLLQSREERGVQDGVGAPGLRELVRLVESLEIDPADCAPHLLMNAVSDQPALRWAADWLKHLVAMPLWHEKQLLGVMLAINCQDVGDYTSVDVQLLRAVADRVAAFLANQHLYDDLADLLMGLLHALVNSIDAKDPYTCGHSERVAHMSKVLAEAAGMSPAEVHRVYLAGLMHDVGKIGVPDAVLCKPGKLTQDEFDAMKRHPEIGARILSGVRQVADLIPGILCHHERLDGRGYPQRLAGREIPLLGRLICVTDCFDAMTTNRTYRAALPLPTAVAEIRRCAGTQFDPALAELFLQVDLERMMKEARECASADPAIGQMGALGGSMRLLRASASLKQGLETISGGVGTAACSGGPARTEPAATLPER